MRDRSRRRSIDWLDPDVARRLELRRFVWWSALAHALVLGALAWSPAPAAPKLPGVVTVDLVAMAAPAAGSAAARSTSPRAPSRPRTAEAPTPVPKPAPPKPAPAPEPPRREAALPKPQPAPEPKKARERAQADPKPKPEAKPRESAPQEPAKPEPARAAKPPPAKEPEPPKPAREEETYDDVLAELRAERGESRPGRAASAPTGLAGATGVAGASARGAGQPLDADTAFWLRAAKLHVESAWIVPPGIQRAALRTVVSVRLDAGGRVLGAPRVTERSANPWYDESVVRAIQKASPLPPPPESGEWRFEFTPPGSAG